MKFIVVLAAFAAVASATPSAETDRNLVDIIQNIISKINSPPISVGPAILEEESPISVGPALVEEESPISVGPALVEDESPISVGPAIVDEYFPVNPVIVDENPIPVGPVIVDENLAIDEVPDVISTLPIYEDEDPITVNIPGGPTINIVINVNSAPQEHEEIEPTPVQIVDDIESTPIIFVDDDEPAQPSDDDDFVPDPEVYY